MYGQNIQEVTINDFVLFVPFSLRGKRNLFPILPGPGKASCHVFFSLLNKRAYKLRDPRGSDQPWAGQESCDLEAPPPTPAPPWLAAPPDVGASQFLFSSTPILFQNQVPKAPEDINPTSRLYNVWSVAYHPSSPSPRTELFI